MCFLDNCCFCISSRAGMLTYIYLKTILNFVLVFLILTLLFWLQTQNNMFFTDMTDDTRYMFLIFNRNFYNLLGYVLIELPFNICGLVGAHKEHLTLVKIHFCYLILSTLVFIAGEMWLVFRILKLSGPMGILDLCIILAPLLVLIVTHTYMLLVVRGEMARINRKNITEKEMIVYKENPVTYARLTSLNLPGNNIL